MLSTHFHAVARQLQEQQLQARQLVLQQQAASAVAAASKTQREVRSDIVHMLTSMYTEDISASIDWLLRFVTAYTSFGCVCCRCLFALALPVQVSHSLLHCLCRCHTACCIACAGAAFCITGHGRGNVEGVPFCRHLSRPS